MTKKVKKAFHFIFGISFLASCIYLTYAIFDDFVTGENDIFEYHEPTNEDFLPRTYPLPENLNVEDQIRIIIDDPNDYSIPPITEEELKNQVKR